jgi:hypothetical protein
MADNHCKDFLEGMDEEADVRELAERQKHPSREVRKKAKNELIKYACNQFADKSSLPHNATGEIDYDKVDDEVVQEGVKQGVARALGRATSAFTGHLEEILADNSMKDALGRLVGVKKLADKVTDNKERDVLAAYQAYQYFTQFLSDFNADKNLGKRQEVVDRMAAHGYGEAEKKDLEGKGETDDDILRGQAALAMLAFGKHRASMSAETVKKYAKTGLEKQAGELEKKYNEAKDKAGVDIYKIMRGAVRKLAESDDTKEAVAAYRTLYAAYKDQLKAAPNGDSEE